MSALLAPEINNLRCEYLNDPIGVDVPKPRLSWIIKDQNRGQKQIAYQIVVGTTPEVLANDRADLWDSGRVEGEQSIQVNYAGKQLESRMRCYWKVRIWEKDGSVSHWSHLALWTMGLLKSQDWSAKWIKPNTNTNLQHPWFRRNFQLKSEILNAKVYVNTPCLYELYINGQKVSQDVLMPAYVHVFKRALYNVYDVEHLLQNGSNCIALWMGPGYYQHKNPYDATIVRAQLEITSTDGLSIIATDNEWSSADSCITQIGSWNWNNFGGECYDAGKYSVGWNLSSFDDRGWAKSIEVVPPELTISWQALPGNQTDQPIFAKSITSFKA